MSKVPTVIACCMAQLIWGIASMWLTIAIIYFTALRVMHIFVIHMPVHGVEHPFPTLVMYQIVPLRLFADVCCGVPYA